MEKIRHTGKNTDTTNTNAAGIVICLEFKRCTRARQIIFTAIMHAYMQSAIVFKGFKTYKIIYNSNDRRDSPTDILTTYKSTESSTIIIIMAKHSLTQSQLLSSKANG